MSDRVREAALGDEAGLARVHVQSWHEAYTGRVPSSLLERMDVHRREADWRRNLSREAPPGGAELSSTWVADEADGIVGFATTGPCRDPDLPPSGRELYALYVLRAHHGSGIATDLLAAALAADPASLWVLADNPRAHAFYAKHGFEPDGAVKHDARYGEPIHEVRLRRR